VAGVDKDVATVRREAGRPPHSPVRPGGQSRRLGSVRQRRASGATAVAARYGGVLPPMAAIFLAATVVAVVLSRSPG
jgi:hypothetical protein